MLILFFTGIEIILLCNLVYVYVHNISDEKFDGCKRLFSWLGKKVKHFQIQILLTPVSDAAPFMLVPVRVSFTILYTPLKNNG